MFSDGGISGQTKAAGKNPLHMIRILYLHGAVRQMPHSRFAPNAPGMFMSALRG